MPGQPRLLEALAPFSAQADHGERAPLLKTFNPGQKEADKAGMSGSLSFLGRVWVGLCCGVCPAILFVGIFAALQHHWASEAAAVLKGEHPASPHSTRWATPPTLRKSGAAKEHDWADDAVDAANDAWVRAHPHVPRIQKLPSSPIESRAAAVLRRATSADSAASMETADSADVVAHYKAAPAVRRPLLHYRPSKQNVLDRTRELEAAKPLVLAARCSLPLSLNYLCSGIIKAALQSQEARIKTEISKHLPSWVQGVALSFDGNFLIAEPTIRLTEMRDKALFGFDPKMRLRCTFESLMRSSKVLGATKLLGEYSGGMCSSTAGVPSCFAAGSDGASDCDPIGDALISDP